ncbi:TetR/AcrR family transcriptional regulator [Granulosicoccus sp. 3-233]|uniref:TetR/AcrR family transcriptional regulator n=1 Tax=Granulosicoccus sp. 3-233 TaxID=3417969 RepID=UPI003D3597F0
MKKDKGSYHHGNLAESLLDAVDELATQFGLEAVSLRACAKRLGVSPSSAFRHYSDKRDLLTAFATRALLQLSDTLSAANADAHREEKDALLAVGLAYIAFAIDKPAFFRAMWNEETIYSSDDAYVAAAEQLSANLKGGFADSIHDTDPEQLSDEELLAWSSVHGLANLFVDGPVGRGQSRQHKLALATRMIDAMRPAFRLPST